MLGQHAGILTARKSLVNFGITKSALFATRRLGETSTALSKSFERLSSGLRINSASDDPAGLAIASKLQSDTRLYTQALRNMNDGISLLNIADETLGELQQILSRNAELAEQAANGVYTLTQRRALNAEANALVDEFNRIIETTKFNGITPLTTADQSVQIQAGITATDYIGLTFGSSLARTAGDGTFGAVTTYLMGDSVFGVETADFNGDSIVDLLTADSSSNTISVRLGNGDGTFKAKATFFVTGAQIGTLGDFNGDGKVDFAVTRPGGSVVNVVLGNGDGSFKAETSYVVGAAPQWMAAADFNDDGKIDLVSTDQTDKTISILLGNGDGTFKARSSYSSSAVVQEQRIVIGDFNGDGNEDIATSDRVTLSYTIFLGNGNGTFQAGRSTLFGTAPRDIVAADFNFDGSLDLAVADGDASAAVVGIMLGNGDGTFRKPTSYTGMGSYAYALQSGDLNGDGVVDIATVGGAGMFVYLGNDNGTFKRPTSFDGSSSSTSRDLSLADLNGDGVLDIVRSNETTDSVGILIGASHRITSIQKLYLLTEEDALASLDIISAAIDRVSAERGKIGASQSRMQTAVSHASVMRENFAAAGARITDLDVAEETSQLVRLQILQQANVAILAQANQQPQLALKLLAP